MRTLVTLFLLTLLLTNASCKKSGGAGNQNAADGAANGARSGTSATPPFATKEPERYQATRIIRSSGGAETATNDAPDSQTFIARDGDRRREDYEAVTGEKISYLQLPEGMYVLLPAKKLYAELKAEASGARDERASSVPPDFSPDKLLNETRPEALYEKLGAEDLNGRATSKYRVIVRGKTGAAGAVVTTESFVWVDESLGMPIKTETTSTGGQSSGARVTMELRDIKETVDANVFDLPADYRKVEARGLFNGMNSPISPGKGRN
jgi:hypothetical protein